MSSNINPNNIDGAYPVAGQDNNSQGFRDNFTNIKQNFQYAEDEINDLQNKVLLKSALVGGILDNNMNGHLIYAAAIRDFMAPRVAITPSGSPVTATINYAYGHYQTFTTNASTTVQFINFPSVNGLISNYGYVKVQINVTNTSHTITIKAPSTGQLLGVSGIQGYVTTNAYTGTITFGATGVYEFGFGSYDGGATITVFDLNRPLTNFSSIEIQNLQLSAETLPVTPTAGEINYDGTVIYSSSSSNQRGVVPSESFITLSSDYVGADSTSAQKVFDSTTNGAITVAGSTTYQFEAIYYITRSAGTTSHVLYNLFGGTATFTSITYLAESTSTAGNALGTIDRIYGTSAAALTVAGASTTANENITLTLKGIMRINAAGTVIPQIQYSAAPGGAPTILKNSYFKLTPIGDSSVVAVGNWS